MINERNETSTEKPVRCLECQNKAKYVKTDYYTTRFGKKVEWDKTYKCETCGTEWIKKIKTI